ncbi:hypothetical protein FRB90_001415, partial [Tulasnella sp. 427]
DGIVARRTASSSGLRNVSGTVPPVPALPPQSSLAPQPTLQRMPSGVSLSATRPMAPEERPRVQHNNSSGSSRPANYPVRGGTPAVTDDSGDDSYMSAYSYSPPRTATALHGDDDEDESLGANHVHHHEPSSTSVAEASLEDHDIARDFGRGHSPLVMARQRSLSNVTASTARGEFDHEVPAKNTAIAALPSPMETASPTVSDYSTHSSTTTTTTRFTSVAGSTEC